MVSPQTRIIPIDVAELEAIEMQIENELKGFAYHQQEETQGTTT